MAFGMIATAITIGIGIAIVLAASAGCRQWFGGITGDTLGATNEAAEIIFLLLVPLLLLFR